MFLANYSSAEPLSLTHSLPRIVNALKCSFVSAIPRIYSEIFAATVSHGARRDDPLWAIVAASHSCVPTRSSRDVEVNTKREMLNFM